MDVAYWLKDDCVEVNSAVTDHEEILARLSELMDAGGNISDNNNYREIFFGEEYRLYTDTFKDKTHLGTTLRFVKGVMIIAVTCGDVKSPGISAVTIPKGIYFPSNDIANNPA